MVKELQKYYLPIREWLELGQALNDKIIIRNFKYFTKYQTQEIRLGNGIKIKADGKNYGPGRYYLKEF